VTERILDSSVLLAVLKDERFDEGVLDVIEGAVISAVNLTEVWTKVRDLGLAYAPRTDTLLGLLDRVEPFTESQARLAADLRNATRYAGLSLGDRACLALALEIDGDVYTAEHAWSQINTGCKIHLIR
jgi:ribonuclease VapC